MKKSSILIITILAILLLIGFFAVKLFDKPNPIVNIKTLQEKIDSCPRYSQEIDPYFKNADCITQLAVEYKNDTICNHIPPSGGSLGWGDGQDCVLKAFISIGNITNCDRLRYFSEDCKTAILNQS